MINVLFLSDTRSQSTPEEFGKSKLPRNIQKSKCEGDIPFLDYLKIRTSSSVNLGRGNSLTSSNFFKTVNFLTDDFIDKYVIFYDVFDGKKSFKTLIKSKRILNDLKNKKCYVIFFHTDCVGWQFNKQDMYWLEFKELVKKQNIDIDRFGFIMYETTLKGSYDKINEIGVDFYSFNNTSKFTYYPDDFAKSSKLDKKTLLKMYINSRGYYRQFKYCSHNNNIKDHRVELLLFLIKENLLDSGITTWFAGNEPIEQGVNKLDLTKFNSDGSGVVDHTEKYGKEVIDIAHDLIPNSYDYKVDGLQDFLNVLPYFNSYFNIITETSWGPNYDFVKPQKIHITEKIWKPISTFQPFILISTKNNLKKLREWGFRTFDGFIDESYDELDTYEERINIINKEIIRLCSMSRKELDDWYWSMEDILVHNSENLTKFIDMEYNKLQKVFEYGWSKV
jgi:hypothetical protein